MSSFPASGPGLADEAEVLARLRAGDPLAFDALFLAYYARLAAYAASLVHDDALAEDLVQDVLMRVWDKRAALHTTSIGAYLFGAVRNAAIDSTRRATRDRARSAQWEREASPDLRPSGEGTDWPPSFDAIERVVGSLPPRSREVFQLKWGQGMRYAEIAALLGISVKTVDAHLATAIKAIRTAFGRPD